MRENQTRRPLRLLGKESLQRLTAFTAQEEDTTGPGPIPTTGE